MNDPISLLEATLESPAKFAGDLELFMAKLREQLREIACDDLVARRRRCVEHEPPGRRHGMRNEVFQPDFGSRSAHEKRGSRIAGREVTRLYEEHVPYRGGAPALNSLRDFF